MTVSSGIFAACLLGSITIELKTIAGTDGLYPLYVEVVPYHSPPGLCNRDLGYVVFRARGSTSQCGGWEMSPTIDISHLVPVGGLYGIRFYALGGQYDFSASLDCVRITGSATTSALNKASWGFLKTLYQ